MTNSLAFLFFVAAALTVAESAFAQDFGQGPRRALMEIETNDLPQGKARIGGGERMTPPGGRSPWHTSGPKLLYILDGTLAAESLANQTLMTCGPAPKLCFFSPQKSLWFFRNAGQGPLRFVLVGIDALEYPTVHEEVGQVTVISGNRVTLAVGDLRSSDLAVPRREATVTVNAPVSVAVGDYVVTIRHNEKDHTAQSIVKLSQRWR